MSLVPKEDFDRLRTLAEKMAGDFRAIAEFACDDGDEAGAYLAIKLRARQSLTAWNEWKEKNGG